MEKVDIPQEQNDTLGGQQKVMYAPNNNGVFDRFNYGSNVEEYATKLAVDEYYELEQVALQEIDNKISSPILYFMYKYRMDIPTLASIVGMFQFRVKRHLKYQNFLKLNDKILSKYADAFDMQLEELKGFKKGFKIGTQL